MGSIREEKPIHVMFLPYLAPGHMMPMVDMARLFAANGVKATIITTTANASRFSSTITRDRKSGLQISMEILRFPHEEAGLPEGCENLSSTPTPEMTIKLFKAIGLLQPKAEELVRGHRPDCIASDYLFPWTVDLASELGIPRLAFSGSGCFNLCVANSIDCHQPHSRITSDTDEFIIPGLPHKVTLTRSQLPDIVKSKTDFSALFDKLKEAERKSYGVLMNSFYELEPAYADHFKKVTGINTWHLGPVSFFNAHTEDKIERGDKASSNNHSCIHWLDSKKPSSVLYICFGSLVRFSKDQISEIATALENSGHSFIWVVGKVLNANENEHENQEWWLPDGFEERQSKNCRGLIIKGWAPQVLILEHKAMGGFLTHCGWNSILEGICAGVPFVTWPIFAEQFYNEKLITQVLKLGIPVGNKTWKIWATQESPVISSTNIEKAINAVMGNGSEAEAMRERASKLAELAKKAVVRGGSSYNDMISLIEDIKTKSRHRRGQGHSASESELNFSSGQ